MIPPHIPPLIFHHAEDAAFYWMQRDAGAHSPLLRFDRLSHFDKLLNAHLDGLRTTGETGWELSLKNLRRWRTNGESFTAHVLMLESAQAQRLEALEPVQGLMADHQGLPGHRL